MVDLRSLAHDLEGVLADAREGRFDNTCLRTIARVRTALMEAEATQAYELSLTAARRSRGGGMLRIYVKAKLHGELLNQGWDLTKGVALKCKDEKLILRPGGNKISLNRSGLGFRLEFPLQLPAGKTLPEPFQVQDVEVTSKSISFAAPAWAFQG